MFRKIPYVPAELQVVGDHPGFLGMGSIPTYNTPVTARENYTALFTIKHPWWMADLRDNLTIHPEVYNAHLGRGMRCDIVDAFGVKWMYEPTAGGSITVAGNPLLEDVNDWKDVIKFPDIDSWDWEGAAKENPINPVFPCSISFVNGFWFERLISFMDFIPAAIALIDEEQTDALKELFEATTEFACRLIDKVCEYWPQVDLIETHDDWGSQKAPFFSNEVAYELFVPYMKKFTDYVHSKGRYALLHSCGHNADRIKCFIDGGFDMWSPQTMNDIGKLYDEYGDKIVLAVWPEDEISADDPEEKQRADARRFVDRFCQKGKPAVMSISTVRDAGKAFLEEVYVYSRFKYLEQE
ncbi:MAG: methyltransferase [Oscillospiraceae bacterium]|nr:methyltransferase [Oscillospiraceae bacterium]